MKNQEHSPESTGQKKKWWRYLMNPHILFLLLVIAIVLFIIFRFSRWGNRINIEEFFQLHPHVEEIAENYDAMVPMMDENGNLIPSKNPHTILFFGNSVFADDRDSENNVVNRIAQKTGATVYNCSVGGSFLASSSYNAKEDLSGRDIYSFYFLTIYLTWHELMDSFDWLESNPDAEILPETQEVRHILETVDMDTVDTIAILYDASDYLAGHTLSNPEDATDVTTFTGSLEAGLEELQRNYPHIRIIVMSPTYAFGVDENGEYVSSDTVFYDKDEKPLSTYMLQECASAITRNVSFVDNIYGTFNEDEAHDYLTDNLHLNQEGREKVVDRFIRALNYYDR